MYRLSLAIKKDVWKWILKKWINVIPGECCFSIAYVIQSDQAMSIQIRQTTEKQHSSAIKCNFNVATLTNNAVNIASMTVPMTHPSNVPYKKYRNVFSVSQKYYTVYCKRFFVSPPIRIQTWPKPTRWWQTSLSTKHKNPGPYAIRPNHRHTYSLLYIIYSTFNSLQTTKY